MFPFLRFSAVTASVIVASTAFGFGLATTILSAEGAVRIEISGGPTVVSPRPDRMENKKIRPTSRLRSVAISFRNVDMANMPAMNPEGPMPGVEHANLGRTRMIASSCLMAMN